ncbi:MAG: hypothetical protein ABI847_10885 [Anaerolineales bacterium]
MPSYMLLHPALGLTTVSLIFAAFAMKAGRHKFWTLHYATGLLAGGAGLAAFSAAVWAVMRRWSENGGQSALPLIAGVHLTAASLVLLALVVQVGLGLAVHYVLGGAPKFLRYHRFNSRVLVALAVVVLFLGVATLGTLMF